jgi:hypothetical protein
VRPKYGLIALYEAEVRWMGGVVESLTMTKMSWFWIVSRAGESREKVVSVVNMRVQGWFGPRWHELRTGR